MVFVENATQQKISREELMELIRDGVEKYGDKCNPRETKSDGTTPSCVYTKDMPRSHENRWCVIGYVAQQLGWSLKGEFSVQGASNMARDNLWPVSEDTRCWMDQVQCVFDGTSIGPYDLNMERTWQEAWNICEEMKWELE